MIAPAAQAQEIPTRRTARTAARRPLKPRALPRRKSPGTAALAREAELVEHQPIEEQP